VFGVNGQHYRYWRDIDRAIMTWYLGKAFIQWTSAKRKLRAYMEQEDIRI
jgi:hypothetical protein